MIINVQDNIIEIKPKEDKNLINDRLKKFKDMFIADKKIYFIIKEQILYNEIYEIPNIFENKYLIFKKLDENNHLNTQSEMDKYIELLSDDDKINYYRTISFYENLYKKREKDIKEYDEKNMKEIEDKKRREREDEKRREKEYKISNLINDAQMTNNYGIFRSHGITYSEVREYIGSSAEPGVDNFLNRLRNSM